jgi:nucleoid-associated protein YgaU
VSLSAHLTAGTAEHGRLAFHPDCPRCRAERLAGSLAADSLVSRRGQAALAAGLLAFSTGAAPALAQVPEPDQVQEVTPGGEPPGLEPDFDPGGEDTFDYDTAPVPGGPEAGGQEDEGMGPPVETEPTTDPDAGLLLEQEQAPAPAPPASEPVPAPTPAPPPAPAAPVTPPPEPPAAELEQPARQPEPRQPEERKAPERPPKTHEVERRPGIGTSPTPESPAPVAQAVTSPAPPTTAPVSEPSPPTTAPVSQPGEPARQPMSGPTYTVRAGDSLWSIARRLLGTGASNGQIAREVNRLWQLNKDRIGTGDPRLIHIGTELRLR